LLSGHGTYTDLQVESERRSMRRHSTPEAETNAPEETADMTCAEAGDVDLTERGLIEVDRSCIIAELHAHEPCKVDMTILVFIVSGEKIRRKGGRSAKWRGPKEERMTYDDRRLAQDYVCGLPRVVREHANVEPGRGIFREEKSCEGDEND
jgi:hypothetical protein